MQDKLEIHNAIFSLSLTIHNHRVALAVRSAWYVLRRLGLILLTILLGVYLTILVANKEGQVDARVERQVTQTIRRMTTLETSISYFNPDERDALIASLRERLSAEMGLNLPTWQRNLHWTFKALTFDWGPAAFPSVMFVPSSWDVNSDVSEILVKHLPNTLLLVGAANVLIFLLGIPLALNLAARKRNQWLDRLFSALSPLSSIPSWIHGILLVAVFAAGLHILPFGGKYDLLPPETQWGYIGVVAKHMVLPVLAILFGMFFQLVYIWRTFFVLYSEEDYVDMAIAKGLSARLIESNYILRPTLPYILTSFALTLVGFWQTTTALEYFFNWPGIGQLYVKALPNFLGENYYAGELAIVISIVVIFAYLLGLVVLLLEIAYAWLDPRIMAGNNRRSQRLATQPADWRRVWQSMRAWIRQPFRAPPPDLRDRAPTQQDPSEMRSSRMSKAKLPARATIPSGFRAAGNALGKIGREILRFPSAVVGLIIILIMVCSSLYIVIALPYQEIGESYYTKAVAGRIETPRNAPPAWINWFRSSDLPLTQSFDSLAGEVQKTSQTLSDGSREVVFTLDLEYPSREFPQDVLINLTPKYQVKRPFISLAWTTPDGRVINLKDSSAEAGQSYFLADFVNTARELRNTPAFASWFDPKGTPPTPAFYLLFADPAQAQAAALPGKYQVKVTGLLFEADSDLEMEFVLIGQVYGLAGTDFQRRDLLVPLLWGMPFALSIGLAGALFTSVFSMIIAAAGVWYGGWVDDLIQRLTEVNMILPVLAIGILLFALYGVNLYLILAMVIVMNIFSSPTKTFRSAFLQVVEAPYIEAARVYGTSNIRIIFRYLIPRILPTMIPQMVILIPTFVFLEATLAIFNVFDPRFPTWGKVIYEALSSGAWWGGAQYWVLEPITLLLLAGLGFALLGSALERILNPRLMEH